MFFDNILILEHFLIEVYFLFILFLNVYSNSLTCDFMIMLKMSRTFHDGSFLIQGAASRPPSWSDGSAVELTSHANVSSTGDATGLLKRRDANMLWLCYEYGVRPCQRGSMIRLSFPPSFPTASRSDAAAPKQPKPRFSDGKAGMKRLTEVWAPFAEISEGLLELFGFNNSWITEMSGIFLTDAGAAPCSSCFQTVVFVGLQWSRSLFLHRIADGPFKRRNTQLFSPSIQLHLLRFGEGTLMSTFSKQFSF